MVEKFVHNVQCWQICFVFVFLGVCVWGWGGGGEWVMQDRQWLAGQMDMTDYIDPQATHADQAINQHE